MEILKELFSFLTDANRHFSTKAGIFVFIIFGTILVNNIFGFTYYYNLNNKIEKATAINKLLQDSINSKDNRIVLMKMRDDVLNRQTVIESTIQTVSNTYKKLNYNLHENASSTDLKKNPSIDTPDRNNFLFVISSSGIYVLLLILIVPLVIIFGFRTTETLNFFTGAIISSAVLYSLAALNYYVFGLIPLIRNNWGWNYILNAVLQIAFLAVVGFLIVRSKKYQNLNS